MAHGHMHATYGGGRRRWDAYVVVVVAVAVLLFVCGTLAVIGLQRLKDTRNFDLLIKQKEEQIHSLNRFLQNERSKVQEAERKTKEMKMQIYNLRAHKSQLNGKVSEMQSMISSLRDEQKTLDLTFQEKENEAKLLQEKYKETLHQKEAEIEDLKQQLERRQAALSANITGNVIEAKNMDIKNSAESKTVSSMQGEEQRERNVTNLITNDAKDEDSGTLSGNESVISRKMSNSQGNGGLKMEAKEKPRYLKKTTGKRWRSIISKPMERKGSRGRQRLAEEIGNISEEEKPRSQENVHDGGKGNVKAKLNGYIDRNTGENSESHDSSTGKTDVAEKNEDRGNIQMEGFEESEIGRSISTESARNDEDNKEEIDETDF